MLILAYLYYNNYAMNGPTPTSMLDPRRTGIYTLCLLASSLTIWLAERKLRAGKSSAFRWLLALTILLGTVFIFGQSREYLRIFHAGVMVNSNLFATTFFTLTGFHGLHVCVGLIALLILMGLAFAGDFKQGRIEAVKSIGDLFKAAFMNTRQFLISAWNWNPWVIAICAATILIYSARNRFRLNRKTGWLLAGTIVFFLTLASPIDTLADGYLFSAHMLQHLLLLLIIPPLILLSLPSAPLPGRFQNGRWRWLNWILRHPVASWFLGIGGMWLWHAPLLCNAAVSNVWIHRLQYVSLLLMGFAFWWPVIGPWTKQRLSPLAGMIYLFTACVGCTVLGIIVTFSPVEVCSIYLHPMDRLGILPLIQDQWGLTPAKDQQLGGLLMWVPACLIYFGGIFGLFARWHGEVGEEAAPESPTIKTLIEKPHGR
jgi:putative membrane protein